MKINKSKDCGNSPKQKLAEDFTIAIATRNTEFLEKHSGQNLKVHDYAAETESPESDLDSLTQTISKNIKEISIHSVISHGKKASANASIKKVDSTNVEVAFFYLFSNAKATSISSITIYQIAK